MTCHALRPAATFAVLLALALMPAAAHADVVVNEIMYHPPTDLETEEYIELYNTGPTTVPLTGWSLSGAVTFAFPAGEQLGPDAYLVLSPSAPAFRALYPDPSVRVIGDYAGRLNNAGEWVVLYTSASLAADAVAYDDEGGWPPEADGDGASLELLNPSLDNAVAQCWAAGAPMGTPGRVNSRYVAQPAPIVFAPRHSPAVPRPGDPIQITVGAIDDSAVQSVQLFYRLDPSVDPFTEIPLRDDGLSGDGAVGDHRYGALLPAQPQGAILEFHVRASDDAAQAVEFPTSGPLAPLLLQVDGGDFSATSPTYRLVMKDADHYWLHTRDPYSNELVNATFICADEIFYNVGVRYRGKGSRGDRCIRKSYRVQFREAEPFHDVENLNLNAQWIRSQWLDMDLMRRIGLPAPATQFAYLVFKYKDTNTYDRYYDPLDPENSTSTMAWRIQMQDVNRDYPRQWFPGRSGGNLYRGVYITSNEQASLQYYGEDKELYRRAYEKKTNETADDFADVIRLCSVFTSTPAASFTDTIRQYIDTDEWSRFWSGMAMFNIEETTLYNRRGDDYFLYFDPATTPTRAVLLPWDLDEANLDPTESIFACTLPQLRRFVEDPDLTPRYFWNIQDLLDHHYRLDIMWPKIEALAPYGGFETRPRTRLGPRDRDTLTLAELRRYVKRRIEHLESVLSRRLVVNVAGGVRIGDEFVCFAPTAALRGRGVTAWTRHVTVDGFDANYQHLTGNWGDHPVTLSPGLNTFQVECLTTAGAVIASETVRVRHLTNPHTVCGTLDADAVWTAADGPHLLTCDVTVPAGRTLTIEPGATVVLEDGVSLLVSGTLVAEGASTRPIAFTGAGASRWGAIAFDGPGAIGRLRHCALDGGSTKTISGAYGGMIEVKNAAVTLEDCAWTSWARHAVSAADPRGAVTIRRGRFDGSGLRALYAEGASIAIEGATFESRMNPASDAVLLRGSPSPAAAVRDCTFLGATRDAIVLEASNATLARNTIRDASRAGIRISSGSQALLDHNVVHDCAHGVQVLNGAVATLDHQTIHACATGIACAYDAAAPGVGPAQATVRNTIVWACPTAATVDATSTLAIEYSDLQGGWTGPGNFALDPLFRDEIMRDLHLRPASPCRAGGQGGTYVGAYPVESPSTRARRWRWY